MYSNLIICQCYQSFNSYKFIIKHIGMVVAGLKKIIQTKFVNNKKKTATKKAGDKRKRKPVVTNSLVNNINARRKSGKSRSKKNSTISEKNYSDMQNNWGKDKED